MEVLPSLGWESWCSCWAAGKEAWRCLAGGASDGPVPPGLVCLISCAVGMVFTMEAGNYWFDIFNDYAATLSLLLIVLVEAVAVCYVYGLRR